MNYECPLDGSKLDTGNPNHMIKCFSCKHCLPPGDRNDGQMCGYRKEEKNGNGNAKKEVSPKEQILKLAKIVARFMFDVENLMYDSGCSEDDVNVMAGRLGEFVSKVMIDITGDAQNAIEHYGSYVLELSKETVRLSIEEKEGKK